MRHHGILHPELGAHLARLGHTDTFVIGDAGLPVPSDVPRLDQARLPRPETGSRHGRATALIPPRTAAPAAPAPAR